MLKNILYSSESKNSCVAEKLPPKLDFILKVSTVCSKDLSSGWPVGKAPKPILLIPLLFKYSIKSLACLNSFSPEKSISSGSIKNSFVGQSPLITKKEVISFF